jgi:hypothetical protein
MQIIERLSDGAGLAFRATASDKSLDILLQGITSLSGHPGSTVATSAGLSTAVLEICCVVPVPVAENEDELTTTPVDSAVDGAVDEEAVFFASTLCVLH